MFVNFNSPYIPLVAPKQVIIGTGKVVVVTGWLVKEIFKKKVNDTDYAAIGQLYSPARGIDALVRNLLYNPQVRHILLIAATKEDLNAKGCQAFFEFVNNGVELGNKDTGEEAWVVNSEIPAYIGSDIPHSYLSCMRKHLTVNLVHDIGDAVRMLPLMNEGALKKEIFSEGWYDKRESFPLIDKLPYTLPGDLYGHRIEAPTIAEAWVKILHRIKTTGEIRPTGYDGHWQELIDLTAVISNEPEGGYFPNPNYLPCTPADVEAYIPQILNDAPKVEGVKYSYGQRLRSHFGYDQIEQVITKLIEEVDAASGVMSLWDVEDHIKGGSPCLNHIWCRVVKGELSLTATFRSNDMFNAWVSNAFGLRALQRYIVNQINLRSPVLNLRVGALITISQSAHIYSNCWESADAIIKAHYYSQVTKPRYEDAVGDFIVSWIDDGVQVERTLPGGSTVSKEYDNNYLRLLRNIAADAPTMSIDHALYLGGEIRRAFDQQTAYKQDSL